jgi:phosphoesterase RecJ-like protein
MGIIQDCGVFQYSNTSPKTLRIAAELIAYGFDFSKLIDETFYEKTYVQNRVLGAALLKSKICLSDAFIYSMITQQDMDELGAGEHDFEGVVSQLRYTKDVKAAALLHETADGTYKVSLRSNGEVDVSKVAAAFGGGGHVRASGCTLSGTAEEMEAALIREIAKQL